MGYIVGEVSGTSYICNVYTTVGSKISYGSSRTQNYYTEGQNVDIDNLNSGIDDVTTNTNTEQPWRVDTKHINDGYPILYWQ